MIAQIKLFWLLYSRLFSWYLLIAIKSPKMSLINLEQKSQKTFYVKIDISMNHLSHCQSGAARLYVLWCCNIPNQKNKLYGFKVLLKK